MDFAIHEKRICVICGKEYIPISKAQKTCSMECRKEFYRRKGLGENRAKAGSVKSVVFNSKGEKRKEQVDARMKRMREIADEAEAHHMSFGKYKELLRREGKL